MWSPVPQPPSLDGRRKARMHRDMVTDVEAEYAHQLRLAAEAGLNVVAVEETSRGWFAIVARDNLDGIAAGAATRVEALELAMEDYAWKVACAACSHAQGLHGEGGCEAERDAKTDWGLVAVRCACERFIADAAR